MKRESYPAALREFLQLMKSEAMFLIMSQLTGLRLHRLAPEDNDEEQEEDESKSNESETEDNKNQEQENRKDYRYNDPNDYSSSEEENDAKEQNETSGEKRTKAERKREAKKRRKLAKGKSQDMSKSKIDPSLSTLLYDCVSDLEDEEEGKIIFSIYSKILFHLFMCR